LERKTECFSFSIVNSNAAGLEAYHPVQSSTTGELKYKLSIVVDNVPTDRLVDSAFWFFLLRMQTWTSSQHNAQVLYETLLPSLIAKPLSVVLQHNVDGSINNTPWRLLPCSGDVSLTHCLMEAVNLVLLRSGLNAQQVHYFNVLVRWQVIRYDLWRSVEMASPGDLTASNLRQLQLCIEQMGFALAEATGVTPEDSLFHSGQLQQMLIKLEEMNQFLSNYQQLTSVRTVPALDCRPVDFVGMPMFQTFVRDSVESLAGPAELEPIFRPIEFTLVPDSISDFVQLTEGLTHADHICTLLAHQTQQIQYTHTLIISMIQHLFTRVIPIPLPHNHAHIAQCMYRQPIRYETQVNLLRLLHHICSHFAAVSMSIRMNRVFDSARILVVAAMAAVADAVVRMKAFDVPSMFSLHLNGTPPPTPRYFFQPFGFDATMFKAQSEDLIFFTPELVATRTRVLDYFTFLRDTIKDDHIIFQFEPACSQAI
jgi:hypothetical protein